MTCLSKQNYKPGDLLVEDCKPFFKLLEKDYKGIRCDSCFKLNTSLKPCSACKQMHYCDKQCQQDDWRNGHKLECQLPGLADKLFSDPNWLILRSVFRILAMLKINPSECNRVLPLPDGTGRCFNNLLDHSESEKNNRVLIRTLFKLKNLMSKGGHHAEIRDLLTFYSICKANEFPIYNENETAKIGHGLYVQLSVFDHSCKPNAFYQICGTEMEVRAIGPIAEGDSICITYIKSHMGRDDRRKGLKKMYGFKCNCDRCVSNLDSDVDFNELQNLIQHFRYATVLFTHPMYFCAALSKHNLILTTLRRLYYEYDDRITIQFIQMFKVVEGYAYMLEKNDVEPFLKDVLDHVFITYGTNHFEDKELREKIARCGFGYLLECNAQLVEYK